MGVVWGAKHSPNTVSPRRRPGSILMMRHNVTGRREASGWIPASAGMTAEIENRIGGYPVRQASRKSQSPPFSKIVIPVPFGSLILTLISSPKRDHDEWLVGEIGWTGSRSGPG